MKLIDPLVSGHGKIKDNRLILKDKRVSIVFRFHDSADMPVSLFPQFMSSELASKIMEKCLSAGWPGNHGT
ncbi:MAG: hypothetical protein OHK006_21190 [Thermodesulfovibrionales bacterium]